MLLKTLLKSQIQTAAESWPAQASLSWSKPGEEKESWNFFDWSLTGKDGNWSLTTDHWPGQLAAVESDLKAHFLTDLVSEKITKKEADYRILEGPAILVIADNYLGKEKEEKNGE